MYFINWTYIIIKLINTVLNNPPNTPTSIFQILLVVSERNCYVDETYPTYTHHKRGVQISGFVLHVIPNNISRRCFIMCIVVDMASFTSFYKVYFFKIMNIRYIKKTFGFISLMLTMFLVNPVCLASSCFESSDFHVVYLILMCLFSVSFCHSLASSFSTYELVSFAFFTCAYIDLQWHCVWD